YVMVDDKPALLAQMKNVMGDRLTTVFVRQGHYADEAAGRAIGPAPDLAIDDIGELATFDLQQFGPHACRTTAPGGPRNPYRTEGIDMTHLQSLRDIGQSLWLDNITREILDDGTLQRYIDEYDITGLTSNP